MRVRSSFSSTLSAAKIEKLSGTILSGYIDLFHRAGRGWSRRGRLSKIFYSGPVSGPGLNRPPHRILHPGGCRWGHGFQAHKRVEHSKRRRCFPGRDRAGPHIPELILYPGSARPCKDCTDVQPLRRLKQEFSQCRIVPHNDVPGKVFEYNIYMHETEMFPTCGRLSNNGVQTIIH